MRDIQRVCGMPFVRRNKKTYVELCGTWDDIKQMAALEWMQRAHKAKPGYEHLYVSAYVTAEMKRQIKKRMKFSEIAAADGEPPRHRWSWYEEDPFDLIPVEHREMVRDYYTAMVGKADPLEVARKHGSVTTKSFRNRVSRIIVKVKKGL